MKQATSKNFLCFLAILHLLFIPLTPIFAQYNIGAMSQDTGNITNDDFACNGQTATVAAGIIGGNETYTWSDPSIGDNQSFSRTFTSSESFAVTITDGVEEVTQVINVVVNGINPNIFTTENTGTPNDGVICSGDNVTLNSGVTGATTYAWSDGGGINQIASYNPTSNTNYTVTITYFNGCSAASEFEVTVDTPSVSITATPSDELCQGELVVLDAGVHNNYQWSSGETTRTIDFQSIAQTTTLVKLFQVTVTGRGGCTATDDVSVTFNGLPAFSISESDQSGAANDDQMICNGDAATLSAAPFFNSTYTYNWSNGATTETTTVSPTSNTIYTVTVTTSNNCSSTASIGMTVNPSPMPIATTNSPICTGEDLNLMESSGTAIVWSWSGPNNFTSTLQNPTIATATTAANGDYYVTVTNNEGCTSTASTAATVYPTPTITTSNNSPICAGEDLMLMETGGEATAWSWSGPDNFTSMMQNPTIATATTAADGTYYVTVTNNEGCTSTASTAATVYPTPVPTITGTFDFCLGRVATLNAGMYEDMPNTYAWSNTETTQIIQTNIVGIYTVTVTNQSGCTGTATAEVTAIPCLAEAGTITTNVNSICPGDDVTISTTGENQGATYTQEYFLYTEDNLGNTTFVDNNSTGIFSGVAAGDYLVCAYNECTDCSPNPSPLTSTLDDINDTATIQNGCYDTECESITVPEALNPIAGTGQTNENNSTGTNIFLANVCGGTPPYSINFTSSEGFASVEDYPSEEPDCVAFQVVYTDAAEWTLSITDSNGCTDGNVTFSSDGLPGTPLPQIESIDMTPETCVGDKDGSLTIEVEGGDDSCGTYSYEVSSTNGFSETGTFAVASGAGTLIVDELASGLYSMTITDCDGTTTVGDVFLSRTNNSGGGRGRGRGGCKTASEEILSEMQVFPNPFNHTTTIAYSLLEDTKVELSVYTMAGQLVNNLYSGNATASTLHRIDFDASELPQGMYILQLKTNAGIVHYEQLTLMK